MLIRRNNLFSHIQFTILDWLWVSGWAGWEFHWIISAVEKEQLWMWRILTPTLTAMSMTTPTLTAIHMTTNTLMLTFPKMIMITATLIRICKIPNFSFISLVRLCGPYVVALLNCTLIFWVVHGKGCSYIRTPKNMCSNEIGLIRHHSRSSIGRAYVITWRVTLTSYSFFISSWIQELEMTTCMWFSMANWMRQFLISMVHRLSVELECPQ